MYIFCFFNLKVCAVEPKISNIRWHIWPTGWTVYIYDSYMFSQFLVLKSNFSKPLSS